MRTLATILDLYLSCKIRRGHGWKTSGVEPGVEWCGDLCLYAYWFGYVTYVWTIQSTLTHTFLADGARGAKHPMSYYSISNDKLYLYYENLKSFKTSPLQRRTY